MALTKTITGIIPAGNSIGVHLKLEDDEHPIRTGSVTVIDEDITENYTVSEGPTVAVRNSIKEKVQAKIDEYKRVKALYISIKYQDALTWINNNTTI